jgi:molybdopterin-guanine dinucleotide biosynthesis protein A
VSPLVGIFVGGRSTRMGGKPKGLLAAPDSGEPLVLRTARLAREAGCEVVLVGRAEAYAGLGLPAIEDRPAGVGPLGGLAALLEAARARQCPAAIAIACDLPRVSSELIARLGRHALEAAMVAPADGQLFARYSTEEVLPVVLELLGRGERALRRVTEALGPRAMRLPLEPGERELLGDWDAPEDLS